MGTNADSSDMDPVVVSDAIDSMPTALAVVDNERIVRIEDPNKGFGTGVDNFENCCTPPQDDQGMHGMVDDYSNGDCWDFAHKRLAVHP